MKFTVGTPKPKSSGRRKGTPNKKTVEVKTILRDAFEGLGGLEALIKWGKENPALFYPIWVKMLPKNLEVTGKDGKDLLPPPVIANRLNLMEVAAILTKLEFPKIIDAKVVTGETRPNGNGHKQGNGNRDQDS